MAERENDILKDQGANVTKTTYKMFCYCQNVFNEDPRKLKNIDFSDLVSDGEAEAKEYCDIWFESYQEILFLQYIPAGLI